MKFQGSALDTFPVEKLFWCLKMPNYYDAEGL